MSTWEGLIIRPSRTVPFGTPMHAGTPHAHGADTQEHSAMSPTRRDLFKLAGVAGLAMPVAAQSTRSTTPVDLAGLRAMNAAFDVETDPVVRARQSIRIAHAAIAVAFTQGLIAREMTTRLIDALDGVPAPLEPV